MNLVTLTVEPYIWVIMVIGIVIILLGIGFLVYVLFVKRHFARKQLKEIERRFDYLHALLIGQDAQYIKRLELISRTNLLYVDIYNRFHALYKEVKNKYDSAAQDALATFRNLVENNHYKNIKKTYSEVKETIDIFEKKSLDLNAKLTEVIKPEEDSRQIALRLKEQLRQVKQNFFSLQADIADLTPSFEAVFEYVESLFEQFEQKIEGAEYDEITNIVITIEKAIKELSYVLDHIQPLYALSTIVLPEKIENLKETYNDLEKQNYPLNHLLVKNGIHEMNGQLKDILIKMKELDLRNISETLNQINERIDNYADLFQKEAAAYVSFKENCDHIYNNVVNLEKRFIQLCSRIPEIKNVYIISDHYLDRIDVIKAQIDKVGAIKRTLDTFIHSSNKQPYTILVEKMEELQIEGDLVNDSLNDFHNYLNSLKSDSEDAYQLIYAYTYRLKQSEKALRDLNINLISDKYIDKIDEAYTILDSINSIINVLPINVSLADEKVKALNTLCLPLFSEIENDYNVSVLAESAIVYSNINRGRFADIQREIKQNEILFYKGEFSKVYHDMGAILKRLRTSVEPEVSKATK